MICKKKQPFVLDIVQNKLLFTPFSAIRFTMHRIYANRINSRGMSHKKHLAEYYQ